MRQHLSDPRFVHKPTARPEDALDLTEHGPRPSGTTTDVVAGPEVDDQIDAR